MRTLPYGGETLGHGEPRRPPLDWGHDIASRHHPPARRQLRSGHHRPVLVTGGTGRTGRRLVERLTARGLPVRAVSRSAPVPFHWEDRSSWGPALDGVRAAYLAYAPGISAPGAAETVAAFAGEAAERGVTRLVLLSERGIAAALPAERALRESGPPHWTVLRCGWFAQVFSEEFLRELVLDGQLPLPAGDGAEPFVDAEDIAEVAAEVLAADGTGHAGRTYELSGPRAWTMAEAAAEIAAATGRQVRYLPVSAEEFTVGMVRAGVPEELARMVAGIFEQTFRGNARPADGVRQVLGREARDFAGYVRATAATGAWRPEAPDPGTV